MTPVAALGAVAGPLAIVLLLRRYSGNDAPLPRVVEAAVAGAAGAFVALLIEEILWPLTGFGGDGAGGTAFRAFVLIALPEEAIKLSLIQARGTAGRDPDYGAFVIAAAATGAGFAAIENLFYIDSFGAQVLWVRLLTATPFHVFNAVTAAWAIGRGLVAQRAEWTTAALALSVALHGLYDFALLRAEDRGGDHDGLALSAVSLFALAILRDLRRARAD